MNNIIKFKEENSVESNEFVREYSDLTDMTETMLMDIRKELQSNKTLSMPIAVLALY